MEHETTLRNRLFANMTNAFTISFIYNSDIYNYSNFMTYRDIYHHIGMWTLSLPSLTTDEF